MVGKIVKKIEDKGYGFIRSGQNEHFFHSSACDGMFNELRVDDEVMFEIGKSPKGPRAENVVRLES